MKVSDKMSQPFSLAEVTGWAEEVVERKERHNAGKVYERLKALMPSSLPGSVYLALNKGTVSELPSLERYFAELVELRDQLIELRDSTDQPPMPSPMRRKRGAKRLKGPGNVDIRGLIALAKCATNEISFNGNWRRFCGTKPEAKPRKGSKGPVYSSAEAVELLICLMENRYPKAVKLCSEAGVTLDDLISLQSSKNWK